MKPFLILALFLSLTAFGQQQYRVTTLSKKYDVELRAEKVDGTGWSGKTDILLFRKKAVKPFQIVHLKDTRMSLDESGQPEIATIKDKQNGKWSSVYLEDFDFDGAEDLAVADGANGGYAGTSYRVYLFDRNRERFVFSPSFTRLTQGPYIGIFEIDRTKKTLTVFWKSSCCIHFSETYLFLNGQLKLVGKINDYYDPMSDPSFEVIETEKLINGKWRMWTKRKKIEKGN